MIRAGGAAKDAPPFVSHRDGTERLWGSWNMRAFNRLLLAGTSPLAMLIAGALASPTQAADAIGETVVADQVFSTNGVQAADNDLDVGTPYGGNSTAIRVTGANANITVSSGIVSGGLAGTGAAAVDGGDAAGNGGYSTGIHLYTNAIGTEITVAQDATVTGGTGGTGGAGVPGMEAGLGGGVAGIKVDGADGIRITNSGTIASGERGTPGTGTPREGRMASGGITLSNHGNTVATNTITNTATGSIQGNDSAGIGIYGANVDINNQGQISGTGENEGVAVITDEGGATNVTNSGTITGGAHDGDPDTLAGDGIMFSSLTSGRTTITNSGTIKGGDASDSLQIGSAIGIYGGVTAEIINSGTLAAGAAGTTSVPRVALSFGDATHAVTLTNNGGTIDGSIVASNHRDLLKFNGGTLNGSIFGVSDSAPTLDSNGAAVSFLSGTTVVNGDIGRQLGSSLTVGGETVYFKPVASVAVADGATLAFGSDSNIHSQSISLGSGSIIDLRKSAVTWNYVSGGSETLANTFILKTTIDATTGKHGYWVFNGMPGGTMFSNGVPVITPTVVGTVSTGSRYVIIQDSAGRTIANLPSVVNGGGYSWAVSSVTGSGQSDTDNVVMANNTTNVVITATNLNAAGAATGTGGAGVRALATYSGSDAGLQALSQAVNNLTSDADIKKAGAQLRPESTVNTAQASMGAVTQALGTIQVRTDAVRVAASDGGSGISSGESTKGLGVWGQAFGTTASQGDRNDVSGYDADTYGLAFGSDFQVLDPLRLGLSFAYAQTSVDSTGDRSGSGQDINSYITSLYGTYSGKGWYVDGTLTYGIHKYDATRAVTIAGAAAQTLKADYSGHQYGAKVESGMPLAVGRAVVTPLVSMAYNNLRQDAYSESGGAAALRVGSSSTDSIRSGLGAKAAAKVGTLGNWEVSPNARAVWYHEFNKSSPEQTSTYVAGGASFITPGNDVATEHFNLGLGVDIASVRNTTISAKYDADLADKYVGHSASLQLRTEF